MPTSSQSIGSNVFSNNSPLSSIISKIAGMLQPQKPITSQISFDSYAAPQQAVYKNFVNTNLIPEWQKNTLNPFMANATNNMAVNNSFMRGNNQKVFKGELDQLNTGLQNQIVQGQGQTDSMIRDAYNRMIQSTGNSPTTNIKF